MRAEPRPSRAGAAVARPPRSRLDVWLVEHGLAATREKAQALIMAGRVRVAGAPAAKPGAAVPAEALVEVAPGPAHVGRGATKLAPALDAFGVDPRGRVAIDVGASTGGFTQVLLERGAARVYAVDVGRAQLHDSLRRDPRVIVKERTNARRLSVREIPEPCGLAVMDVSFISALKILPALACLLDEGADLLLLVKPQFEVGKGQVGRGGLVKDPALHREVLLRVVRESASLGYAVLGVASSPVAGARGNREFFLHLRARGAGLPQDAIARAVERSVEP